MNNPRTSPLQAIPSRPARAKHALKGKRSIYAIRGADTIPGYVVATFPGYDRATYDAMVNAIQRYLTTPDGERNGVPTPAMCKILFDGLI